MIALWVATAFLGSALLFAVEPMVARMLLPRLGGTPAVWTTCVLFFQIALLGGYAYAHHAGALGGRAQVALHAVLLATALAAPVAVVASGHLLALFVAAMVCHGELARLRPGAERG